MPYITREDGEHFVIPTYRDTLRIKNKSELKKEIQQLSDRYGAFITLQKKGLANQYEIAVSPDTGYLLGESIWNYFKKPVDLIYCEALPNTKEALLVIVSGGSVYLDGSFPLENIQEELIALINQKNQFEIYIYGDVPLASDAEIGKFNFPSQSIKSFQILTTPIFPILPRYRIFQFQLVNSVLKNYGIGVLPYKSILAVLTILSLIAFYWEDLNIKRTQTLSEVHHPLEAYSAQLSSPSAFSEMQSLINDIQLLYALPGWTPLKFSKINGSCSAQVKSSGGSMQNLLLFARKNNLSIGLQKDGVNITWFNAPNMRREAPTVIYPIEQVIAIFVDRIHEIYSGHHIAINTITPKDHFKDCELQIKLDAFSPMLLSAMGRQLDNLPLVFKQAQFEMNDGSFSGTLSWQALGE